MAVKRFAASVQHHDVGDVSFVKLLDQLLLFRRTGDVQVDHDKVYLVPIFVVELNRTPGLALGVEASFPIDDDVIRPARNET